MGLFSLFRTKAPHKVADELFAASLTLTISPKEREWVNELGIDVARYLSERNALRVGMTEAGVALALGIRRRVDAPRTLLADALSEKYEKFFAGMETVSPEEGRWYYVCVRNRYTLRMPEETTGIFHYYLFHPGAWRDKDHQATPAYAIPAGFQAFVQSLMKASLEPAAVRAKELDA
jgi:hypothetical protein